MTYDNLSHSPELKTGADCTGSTGTTGRTYTLTNANVISNTLNILKGQIPLFPGLDFTITGQVVTFNVYVDDSESIYFDYWTGTVASGPISGASYCVASDVEAHIRATTPFASSTIPSLVQVNDWIKEMSALIDARLNMTFASEVVSSEYYDVDDGRRDPIGRTVSLTHKPVISVDKVEYNMSGAGQAAAWVTLTEGDDKDYRVYLDEGEIEFFAGTNGNHLIPAYGRRRLRISYTSGYSTVPQVVSHLCQVMVVGHVVQSLVSSQANTEMGNVSVGSIRVADPSNFGLNYLKALDEEIKFLFEACGNNLHTYVLSRYYG